MAKRLVVVDGDILAYRCASAIEKRSVECTHKDTLDVVTFDTATAFKEWAGDSKGEYTLEPKRESEDISHAIHAMKGTLTKILNLSKCDSYHIVVSGQDNFRDLLPLPTKYKDARKEAIKPLHLAACKEYLIQFKGAEVAVGEADDLLVAYAVAAWMAEVADRKAGVPEGEINIVVQASLDKDANHGPGRLLNWLDMDEPEIIDGYGGLYISDLASKTIKGKGRSFLYFQMLFGDPVDCYKPCELAKGKLGETGAYKLLSKAANDKEAMEVLVAQYKKWYPTPVTYRAWDDTLHTKDWMEIMQMYADCAFMRRWEGDRLVVKTLLDKLKVVYE